MARVRKPKASEVVAAAVVPAAEPGPPARQRYGAVRKDAGKRGRAKQRQAFLAERRGIVDADSIEAAVQARRRQVAVANAPRPRAGARGVPVPAEQHLWLPIGPTVVLGGQASGLPRVSGRMNDVHVSSDGQRAYAASANGGVWYSDDAGESWRPLGGWTTTAPAGTPPSIDQPSSVLTCGCMLVRFDPGGNAALDEVLVGTGELIPSVIGLPFGQNSGVGVLYGDHPTTAPLFGSPWQREGNNLSGKGIFRMARDPASPARLDAATIVAATSAGLYSRSGAPNAAWTVVPAARFRQLDGVTPLAVADTTLACTDVCWLAGGVVFVAVSNATAADPALYVSSAGLAGPFMPIVLAGLAQVDPTTAAHVPSRLSLAPAPSDATVLYVLGSGNLVWRLDNRVAVAVQNIPPNLLGGQDTYNQAIAVHPTRPERLLLGGATENIDAQWCASLYIASVTAPVAGAWRYGFAAVAAGADPTVDDSFIGSGVHADVHIARFVTVGARNELWIGCDGGIFRSLRGNDDNRLVKRSFIARNTGLATLQCGYVATSPAADGFVVAGAQDNALLERIGVNLWRRRFIHGDAGSVAFDPAVPHRYVSQVYQATWNSTDPVFTPPVFRVGAGTAAETTEDLETAFYTGIDAVRVPGVGAAAATSRLAFGSTRVWLSADWGATWCSLPSLGDPMAKGGAAPAQNNDTDACVDDGNVPPVRNAFRGQVLACRWASPDRLYVLCRKEVLKYELIADASVAGGLRSTKTVLTVQNPVKKEDRQAAATVVSPGQRLPRIGEWSDIAAHDNSRGPHGSFYVAGTGNPAKPEMDTLWWFDGTNRWHATGLRTDPDHPDRRVPAPAYAVVVDKLDRNTVYVGTAVGVWRGVFDPGATKWAWFPMTNGLPEAIVHDLHLHDEVATGQRLLRAAIHARGIWEVDLAQPSLQARSFVRVHDFDTRRSSPSPLTDPRSAVPNSGLSWHASPDLRVRPRRGSPPPAATVKPTTAVPWAGNTPDAYGLWVFQTALHARGAGDPLVKPDGIWTPVFEARLRAVNGNSNRLTRAFWNTVVGSGASFPDAYADPWNGSLPSEADLFELIVDLPKPGGSPASIAIGRVNARVDVQVHHRHSDTLPADQVRVTLLARDISGTDANDSTWAALPCAWTGPAQGVLRAGGALPAFGSLPALADGWRFADTTQPVRNPTGPLDPRLSRVVSFDVDLAALLGPPQVPAVPRRLMLVAVIHTQADPVDMTGGTLRAVVLANRFVAARSLEVV